jgi:hypothetical protein
LYTPTANETRDPRETPLGSGPSAFPGTGDEGSLRRASERLVSWGSASPKSEFLKLLRTPCRVEGVDPDSKRSAGSSANTLGQLFVFLPRNRGRGVAVPSKREVRLVGVRTPPRGEGLKLLRTPCRVEGVDPDSKRSAGSSANTLGKLLVCLPRGRGRGVAAPSKREVRLVGPQKVSFEIIADAVPSRSGPRQQTKRGILGKNPWEAARMHAQKPGTRSRYASPILFGAAPAIISKVTWGSAPAQKVTL